MSPPTSDRSRLPVSLNPRQKAEQTNYLIKELGFGSFANVYLSVPKSSADEILASYAAGPATRRHKAAAVSRLRNALQAIKISNDRATAHNTNDIDKEIRVLKYLGGKSSTPTLCG